MILSGAGTTGCRRHLVNCTSLPLQSASRYQHLGSRLVPELAQALQRDQSTLGEHNDAVSAVVTVGGVAHALVSAPGWSSGTRAAGRPTG